MKKYYGYVLVADKEEKETVTNTLKSSGGTIEKGLMGFILKKLVKITAPPLYRDLVYDAVVFYCSSQEQVDTCINEDILQNGGWRIM